MLGHRIALISALLLALLAPAAGAQSLQDLSAGAPCADTYGEDVGPDGTVLVAAWCPDGEVTALAVPGAPLRAIAPGYGTALGDGGHVAIGRPSGAVLWHDGQEVPLAPLGGYDTAWVHAIDPAGRAVGSSDRSAPEGDTSRGTLWSPAPALIAGLSAGSSSAVVAITAAGWMAGYSGGQAWRRRPDGGYVKLSPILARGGRSFAAGMSSAGDVVGESEDKGLRMVGVLWPAGSTTPVKLPSPRRGWARYRDVNASRVAVGESGGTAVAWSPRSGLVDLNRYAPAGFALRRAVAVNDAGQLTGFGTRDGRDRAFRLTLPAGF